ncbi:hypothetical protein PICSAR138_04142 [Mycobacterium avium subsp. paratuberculosis]|nr:hypothetical protein PICSAR138_04142 [Mycobacterium avium subsp. paratuberculosis]
MTSSDCGRLAAILREYSSEVSRSWSPQAIRVGTRSSVHSPAVSSWCSNASRKPTMVGMGVLFIIRWENASRLRLTCRSLKEAARNTGPISERDTLRPRCISFGADRAATRTASSAGFFKISPSGDRETPSAADEISAAPTIRRPYCSGNWRACESTVMPPIEWPTSTTSPRGATTCSTVCRSRPSWVSV